VSVVLQELCEGQLKLEHARLAFIDGIFLVFVELVQVIQQACLVLRIVEPSSPRIGGPLE
jgi:hypothetical protein